MDEMLTIAISGMSAIASLFLISAGLAVIFGLMRVVNMAHGEFLMVGALTTTTLVGQFGWPWWLAMATAPLVGAVLGVLLYVLLIARIPQGRLVETLLVTFGASLVMYQIAVNVFGTTPPGIATPFGAVNIGNYAISAYSIFLIFAAALMAGALYLLFTRSKYGLLARAAAQNPLMAQALGVAAGRVNLISFALGCAVAALGGALIAPMVSVSPSLGQAFVGQAFMAVVIAGPAFVTGTMISAIMLGGISSGLSQGLTTLWGVTGLFLTAIVILRIRPTGLSGPWKRAL